MNKAIVICYVGKQIEPDAVGAIASIISGSCKAMPELITIKAFDEDSIAKAILKKTIEAEDRVVAENNATLEQKLIEEARIRAVDFITSKYNGLTGGIKFARDIAMAKYHHRVNAADDDETVLLNAIDVLSELPDKTLADRYHLGKALRETIFAMKDM